LIATAAPLRLLVRLTAPLAFAGDRRVARKLEGFAATEAGSALDMLKAAELTDDPLLRRLFFRHAMDEARHAGLFRASAREVAGDARPEASVYDRLRATRQNLYRDLGLVPFVAFVHLAERRGELQFRALARHFHARPPLAALFARVGRDERFHVAYSAWLLRRWRRDPALRWSVTRALWRVRSGRVRAAWRRAGCVLGDVLGHALLGLLYLLLLPPFALLARALDPPASGWRRPAARETSLAAARRQH
jgi:rubrerythrin